MIPIFSSKHKFVSTTSLRNTLSTQSVEHSLQGSRVAGQRVTLKECSHLYFLMTILYQYYLGFKMDYYYYKARFKKNTVVLFVQQPYMLEYLLRIQGPLRVTYPWLLLGR